MVSLQPFLFLSNMFPFLALVSSQLHLIHNPLTFCLPAKLSFIQLLLLPCFLSQQNICSIFSLCIEYSGLSSASCKLRFTIQDLALTIQFRSNNLDSPVACFFHLPQFKFFSIYSCDSLINN